MTAPLLLDFLLKGVAVLAIATLVVQCMRRSSAAARHLLWTCALTAALILPLASVILPAWRVLPQWMDAEAVVATPEEPVDTPQGLPLALPSRTAQPASAPQLPLTSSESVVPTDDPKVVDVQPSPTNTAPDLTVPPPAPIVPRPTPPAPPIEGSSEATSAPTPFPWVTLWWVGLLFMLLPLALSAFSLFRLERRSKRLTTGPLSSLVAELSRELNLGRNVRLLLGPNDAMPMVWGFWRNRLLLPKEATTWPEDTLRTVLLHELSHLNRRDPLTLCLSHLSLALHWPNPFAWLALRGVRMECEQAADDAVLRSGVRPSDYATDMLSLSEQCRPLLLKGAAMSMARPSTVTKRISAVLERGRNRRQLAIRVCVLTTLTALLLALPLAMLQAVVIAQEEKKKDEVAASFEEQTKAYLALQNDPYTKERAQALKELHEKILKHDPEKLIEFGQSLEPNTAASFISGGMAALARRDESDLNALVKRVNAMKIVVHRESSASSVVTAVAEKDPALAVSLIPKFMLRSEVRQAAEAYLYEDLIVRDPVAAAPFIAARPRNRITGIALRAACAYWGARDLIACLNWARTLPVLEDRRFCRHAAIHAYARKKPKEIVTTLQGIQEEGSTQSAWMATPPQLRGPVLLTAYDSLRGSDAEAVEPWLASLPKDGSVPENWLKTKRPAKRATIDDALKLPEASEKREEIIHQRLNEMVRKDPKRALELSLHLPTRRRNNVAHSAAQNLIKTDLDAAVAFFDKHPSKYAVTNGNAFVDTYSALARRDLRAAEKVLAFANDPRCRTAAGSLRQAALAALLVHDSPERAYKEASKLGEGYVRAICRSWLNTNRVGFLEWMKLSKKNRVQGLVALISETSEPAPFTAAKYITELDALGYHDPSYHWRWAISKIFSQMLRQDEKHALKWAKELKSKEFTVPTWFGVARHIGKSDPDAAAKWISTLPAGSGRKAAAQGFFESQVGDQRVYGSPFSIGSSAFKADSFGKPKEKAAIETVAQMKPKHHDSVRLVLKALELEEETHQRILKSFAK